LAPSAEFVLEITPGNFTSAQLKNNLAKIRDDIEKQLKKILATISERIRDLTVQLVSRKGRRLLQAEQDLEARFIVLPDNNTSTGYNNATFRSLVDTTMSKLDNASVLTVLNEPASTRLRDATPKEAQEKIGVLPTGTPTDTGGGGSGGGDSSSSSSTGVIIGVVCGCLVLIAIVAVVLVSKKRTDHVRRTNADNMAHIGRQGMELSKSQTKAGCSRTVSGKAVHAAC